MRLTVFSLVLGLALFGSAAGSAPATFSDRELIDGFMRTVFGSENIWVARNAKNRVSKFAGPVRVFVSDKAKSRTSPDVRRFIRDVNRRVSSLRISTTSSRSKANYHVYLVKRTDYQAIIRETLPDVRTGFLERAACSGIAFLRPDGAISRAIAFIVVDEGQHMFRHCMVEEILQGLGPSNDSPRLEHSIFNDRNATDQFTSFDSYILNMLYHPRIKAGMRRSQVRELLPSIVRDVRGRRG